MEVEALIDPPFQPVIPVVPAPEEIFTERAEFAFTSKQRQWWLRVYTNQDGKPQCAFTEYSEGRGWHKCEVTGDKNLEVHHIQPAAWTHEQEPWQDPNDTLGVVLCRHHHDRVIHPDIGSAFDNYRQDPDIFKKTIEQHRDLARQGVIFWNSDYDRILEETARMAKMAYVLAYPNDPYPDDSSWKKVKHPKKPHWIDGF